MKRAFFLNIVVRKCPVILQLFSRKNQPLLVGWYTFSILNFGFYGFNRIGVLYIQRNRFTGKSFDKNLHRVVIKSILYTSRFVYIKFAIDNS